MNVFRHKVTNSWDISPQMAKFIRTFSEFKNGSNVLKRLYAYSDTLINNETAIVVINKLSEAVSFIIS